VQVPTDQIDAIMKQRAGLGHTGETYLIGADLRMRSNSALSETQTILGAPVETEQTQAWLEAHGTLDSPLKCTREAPLRYMGHRGARVLGLHKTIEVAGVRLGVRDHGGELSVESEVGAYTRFHVDLPV